MKSGKLKHGIQKVNLIRILFPFLFLLLLTLFTISFPIFSCLFPSTVESSKSPTELYSSKQIYIKTTTGKLYYTGYDYLKGTSVKGHYFYSLEDGRCTIYLFSTKYFTNGVPATVDDAEFDAVLIHNKSNLNQLISLMAKDLGWTYDGLASYTDTVIVSQMNYAIIPSILLGILIFFAFSFSLAHILTLVFNICKPQYAYTFVRLGHHKTRKKFITNAAKELEYNVLYQSEHIYVTNNFFIYLNNHNIAIIPLENIAWAYKYSRLHKYYLFGEMDYTIKIYTKDKKYYVFRGNSKEASDYLLEYLKEHLDNILIGYTFENRIYSKK